MIEAQRVDFIAVPVRDRERAARFYEDTLGLHRNPNSTATWVEFETGNVTLALVDPPSAGQPFVPLPFGSIVIRVPDVDAAKARLREAGPARARQYSWASIARQTMDLLTEVAAS